MLHYRYDPGPIVNYSPTDNKLNYKVLKKDREISNANRRDS